MTGTATGVRVAEIVEDAREPEQRFIPGHPDADAKGYVAFPRINPAEDMVDLMGASRGCEVHTSGGLQLDDRVVARGEHARVKVGWQLLGRVLDGFGEPINNGPPIEAEDAYDL